MNIEGTSKENSSFEKEKFEWTATDDSAYAEKAFEQLVEFCKQNDAELPEDVVRRLKQVTDMCWHTTHSQSTGQYYIGRGSIDRFDFQCPINGLKGWPALVARRDGPGTQRYSNESAQQLAELIHQATEGKWYMKVTH